MVKDTVYRKMILHHDQDPVYTGYGWTSRLLLKHGLRISYTLDGARSNSEMEGLLRRLKNENRSLFLDAPTLEVLRVVVGERKNYYNHRRRHSRIGYQVPVTYLKQLKSELE